MSTAPRIRPLCRRQPRWLAALCAGALLTTGLCPPAAAQVNLPALGDTESEDFGIGTERKLGDQVMREIRRDPDYLDDPVLLEYIESLWTPLMAQARVSGNISAEVDQRFAWETFLVRDRAINAFALPGGYVGVYLGLIGLTASRDELASVLAHELSHVTQRHIARSIAAGKRQSLIGAAAMILGVLAAARSNVDAANALIVGGQAAAMQGQLNFSRDMEREADRIGFSLLTSSGYAPGGMAAMFEKLDQSSRLNDSGAFPYLRSHPLSSERIGEARSRLGTGQVAPANTDFEHALAQARARVLMDSRVDALRRWQAMDSDRPGSTPAERLSAAYSSALASTLLRDWARADAALAVATRLASGEARGSRVTRSVALLAAQSLFERGDAAHAATTLQPFVDSASRPVMLLDAQVALALASRTAGATGASGSADAAAHNTALKRSADRLQTWLALHPRDAAAWAQLGQAWTHLGQPLRAMRAEAEVRLALGDLNGAVDRLRAGQRSARSGASVDFIDASVIDARLRQIEIQRRQIAADERAATESR